MIITEIIDFIYECGEQCMTIYEHGTYEEYLTTTTIHIKMKMIVIAVMINDAIMKYEQQNW